MNIMIQINGLRKEQKPKAVLETAIHQALRDFTKNLKGADEEIIFTGFYLPRTSEVTVGNGVRMIHYYELEEENKVSDYVIFVGPGIVQGAPLIIRNMADYPNCIKGVSVPGVFSKEEVKSYLSAFQNLYKAVLNGKDKLNSDRGAAPPEGQDDYLGVAEVISDLDRLVAPNRL